MTTEPTTPAATDIVQIKHRWTDAVLFEAHLSAEFRGQSCSIRLGAAVKMGLEARVYLANANLAGANLAGANLAGAYLTGANLTGANLADANLAGANLTGANLANANLARVYLANANLARVYLAGANLAGANLTGVYLAGANLAGANLTGANLADANLADANLAGANLARVYLAGANLTGVYLADANLAPVLSEAEIIDAAAAVCLTGDATRHQQAQDALADALIALTRANCRLGWSEGKAAVQVAHAAAAAALTAVRNLAETRRAAR